MKAQGIMPGNFYWYDNNWHYIKKWDHLKKSKSLFHLSLDQQLHLMNLDKQDFSASDAIMSCCISTAISLLWTDDQIEAKANKMVEVARKVIGR